MCFCFKSSSFHWIVGFLRKSFTVFSFASVPVVVCSLELSSFGSVANSDEWQIGASRCVGLNLGGIFEAMNTNALDSSNQWLTALTLCICKFSMPQVIISRRKIECSWNHIFKSPSKFNRLSNIQKLGCILKWSILVTSHVRYWPTAWLTAHSTWCMQSNITQGATLGFS